MHHVDQQIEIGAREILVGRHRGEVRHDGRIIQHAVEVDQRVLGRGGIRPVQLDLVGGQSWPEPPCDLGEIIRPNERAVSAVRLVHNRRRPDAQALVIDQVIDDGVVVFDVLADVLGQQHPAPSPVVGERAGGAPDAEHHPHVLLIQPPNELPARLVALLGQDRAILVRAKLGGGQAVRGQGQLAAVDSRHGRLKRLQNPTPQRWPKGRTGPERVLQVEAGPVDRPA